MKVGIFFDLEGPLTVDDIAYKLCVNRLEYGDVFFKLLSLYDDILTSELKGKHKPGTTLIFILPFLLAEGVKEEDILCLSNQTKLISGAEELIKRLKEYGHAVGIISTSYHQHAYNIADKLGVDRNYVACSRLSFCNLNITFAEKESIKDFKKKILNLSLSDTSKIKSLLDEIFFIELPKLDVYKSILKHVNIVGGEDKFRYCVEFANRLGIELSEVCVVGDGITDAVMLRGIKEALGLSIAFNANEYAIMEAELAFASETILDILMLIEAWMNNKEYPSLVNLTILNQTSDLEATLSLHKRMRERLRGVSIASLS